MIEHPNCYNKSDAKPRGIRIGVEPVSMSQLVLAVLEALHAPNPHRGSPAWAVHNIYSETGGRAQNSIAWAQRFIAMQPGEYSVRWDIEFEIWGFDSAIAFSGLYIARQCVFWAAQGRDFSSHNNREHLYLNIGREPCEGVDDNEKEETEHDDEHFLLPYSGEIVQRRWAHEKNGHIIRRFLDIRQAEKVGYYEYVVQEEDNPELVACSAYPLDRNLLEVCIQGEILSFNASAPYIIPERKWLRYTLCAAERQHLL